MNIAELHTQFQDSLSLVEMVVIPADVDMATIANMLDAAKRGLGLANKLSDPIQRKRHARAVLINLNKIRAALARLVDAEDEGM